jgi:hypothetical protein
MLVTCSVYVNFTEIVQEELVGFRKQINPCIPKGFLSGRVIDN